MKILRLGFLTSLILALCVGMTLNGCIKSSDSDVDRQMTLSARWISGDSTFVFSIHDEVAVETLPGGRTTVIRIFEAKVDHSLQAYEVAEVYDLQGEWGCSDLRVIDSVVFLSYYRHPEDAGVDQEGCPNTRHGTGLFAGRLGSTRGDRLWKLSDPDTAAMRVQLAEFDGTEFSAFDSGFRFQSNPSASLDICVIGGRCLSELVEIWDAGK